MKSQQKKKKQNKTKNKKTNCVGKMNIFTNPVMVALRPKITNKIF
jgi:hypothetical protein